VAQAVGAKALGLTHHDPASSDELVDDVVAAARALLTAQGIEVPVFGCRDNLTVEVGRVADAVA